MMRSMILSFPKASGSIKRPIVCAIAAIFLLVGQIPGELPSAGAQDGYVLPKHSAPFYKGSGRHKPARLMMSAYPFPDDEITTGQNSDIDVPDRELSESNLLDRVEELDLNLEDRMDDASGEDSKASSLSDLDLKDLGLDLDDMDLEDTEEEDDDDEEEEDDISLFEMNRDRLARVEGGRFVLPALQAASVNTDNIGNGRIPQSLRDNESIAPRMLAESGSERYLDDKPWNWTVGRWAAANTFSFPRYFEDRMLERHGHERYPALQPFASGLRFAATVPALPYLMTLSPPRECESTLGYFRPGSLAPAMHQQPPYSNRAMLVEAAALAAGIAILP